MSGGRPRAPGPRSFELLEFVARLDVAAVGALQYAFALSRSVTYSHLQRLDDAELVLRLHSHDRGRSHPGFRTELISDFCAAQAGRPRAKVANKTGAPAEVVADACQTAWAILLRRPDISLDARGLSWLTAVAVHEVYRQWRDRAHNLPMGALSLGVGDPGELSEPVANGNEDVEELAVAHLEHAERVADMAALKPAERTALYLQALGYRYREIASVTDASYTAVNRRLTEGRARLRRIARERDSQPPT